ncbi:MAG: hypothetical protein LBG92_01140 [Prevotellaceae bacterium]|nr:hypothetical protein [Prevotellaceae bacterium]
MPERQNFNAFAIEFCLSGSQLLSFLAAGNAALACGYEGSAFQAVFWLGQKPQATLSLACGCENFVLSGHYS